MQNAVFFKQIILFVNIVLDKNSYYCCFCLFIFDFISKIVLIQFSTPFKLPTIKSCLLYSHKYRFITLNMRHFYIFSTLLLVFALVNAAAKSSESSEEKTTQSSTTRQQTTQDQTTQPSTTISVVLIGSPNKRNIENPPSTTQGRKVTSGKLASENYSST
jgi:hypothetical protein